MEFISNFKIPLIIVACLVIGFSAGKFSSPSKVVEHTVIQTVTKEADSKKTENDVIVTERTTKKSNGDVVTEVIHEKDHKSEVDHSSEQSSLIIHDKTTENRSNYSVGVYTSTRKDLLINVDRRILGGVSVGIYGLYDPSQRIVDTRFGVGVRLEF
jgi:hypothetical protein